MKGFILGGTLDGQDSVIWVTKGRIHSVQGHPCANFSSPMTPEELLSFINSSYVMTFTKVEDDSSFSTTIDVNYEIVEMFVEWLNYFLCDGEANTDHQEDFMIVMRIARDKIWPYVINQSQYKEICEGINLIHSDEIILSWKRKN